MPKIEEDYTYWSLEVYDQKNGIRGGGGLGILAADMRRIAEQNQVPFTLITPFYPEESHQTYTNGETNVRNDKVDYHDFGFQKIGSVKVNCNGEECPLEIIEKTLGTTRFLCMTEPNFGELYSGPADSDHRLYQQVALGFGGYQALKLAKITPKLTQLNEVATLFAAVAHLDDLVANGTEFQTALTEVRQQTLYTNHTLVQAAEAEFSLTQFENYVFTNLCSTEVEQWIREMFKTDRIKLSTITIEIAALRSGVSKLHARVADYKDLSGKKVKFTAITNGIDLYNWTFAPIMDFYQKQGILDDKQRPTSDYKKKLTQITHQQAIKLKQQGRELLNQTLKAYPDHTGQTLHFAPNDLIFTFKRRFVEYKRPDLPFKDPAKLAQILKKHNAHYIFTGRVHPDYKEMVDLLHHLLDLAQNDPILRDRIHYLPDYDERLAFALTSGGNVTINVPVVGLEACGTSWEKDIANLNLIISTHDGGVADTTPKDYLNVSGANENEEATNLYQRMNEAARAWEQPEQLEYWLQTQLKAFLPILSGTRMLDEYLHL